MKALIIIVMFHHYFGLFVLYDVWLSVHSNLFSGHMVKQKMNSLTKQQRGLPSITSIHMWCNTRCNFTGREDEW